MRPTDKEIISSLCEALRPFARAYIALHPAKQIALAESSNVRVTHLRDAYLMLAKVEGPQTPTPLPPRPSWT